jgi:hypothetical protein
VRILPPMPSGESLFAHSGDLSAVRYAFVRSKISKWFIAVNTSERGQLLPRHAVSGVDVFRILGLANGFPACGHNLTNLSLSSTQHLPELDTRVPDLAVCGFNPIEAFGRYPFPGVFPGLRCENYADCSTNGDPGCHVFTYRFHVSPFLDARFGVICALHESVLGALMLRGRGIHSSSRLTQVLCTSHRTLYGDRHHGLVRETNPVCLPRRF